jgi:hypothetical protein
MVQRKAKKRVANTNTAENCTKTDVLAYLRDVHAARMSCAM